MNPDFLDLIAAMNAERAEYLVVGGHALSFHTEHDPSESLEVWVRPSTENTARILRAFSTLGAPRSERGFKTDLLFDVGVAGARVRICLELDGVGFDEAWSNRSEGHYGDQRITVIGRNELTRNKLASGRAEDLAAVRLLRRLRSHA